MISKKGKLLTKILCSIISLSMMLSMIISFNAYETKAREISGFNLALGKSVRVSGTEINSLTGDLVVDGDYTNDT